MLLQVGKQAYVVAKDNHNAPSLASIVSSPLSGTSEKDEIDTCIATPQKIVKTFGRRKRRGGELGCGVESVKCISIVISQQ